MVRTNISAAEVLLLQSVTALPSMQRSLLEYNSPVVDPEQSLIYTVLQKVIYRSHN